MSFEEQPISTSPEDVIKGIKEGAEKKSRELKVRRILERIKTRQSEPEEKKDITDEYGDLLPKEEEEKARLRNEIDKE